MQVFTVKENYFNDLPGLIKLIEKKGIFDSK